MRWVTIAFMVCCLFLVIFFLLSNVITLQRNNQQISKHLNTTTTKPIKSAWLSITKLLLNALFTWVIVLQRWEEWGVGMVFTVPWIDMFTVIRIPLLIWWTIYLHASAQYNVNKLQLIPYVFDTTIVSHPLRFICTS